MMLLPTLTGLIHVLFLSAQLHPIHVSVTEIDFDRSNRALEIMMRVFIDDMELTLRNSLNKPDLDLLNPPKGTNLDELVDDYLKEHFKIKLDGKQRDARYLGHELEGEALIFFIEVSDVDNWRTITVHNDVIMSTYEDQSNLVHVYVGDKVKSLRLTRNTPGDELTFD